MLLYVDKFFNEINQRKWLSIAERREYYQIRTGKMNTKLLRPLGYWKMKNSMNEITKATSGKNKNQIGIQVY